MHLGTSLSKKDLIIFFLGKYMVFYDDDSNGNSRVMTLVHRDLKLEVVYRHLERRVIAIKVTWNLINFTMVNVYAPNQINYRAILWKELKGVEWDGEWCIVGDFNMVEFFVNERGPHSNLVGGK